MRSFKLILSVVLTICVLCASAQAASVLNFVVVASSGSSAIHPLMSLNIDGKSISQFEISANHQNNEWQTLTYAANAPEGFQNFSLQLLKDEGNGGIFIKSFSVNGVAVPLENGKWLSASGLALGGQPVANALDATLSGGGTIVWGASALAVKGATTLPLNAGVGSGASTTNVTTTTTTSTTADITHVNTGYGCVSGGAMVLGRMGSVSSSGSIGCADAPQAACTDVNGGSHASGSTYAVQISQSTGSVAATVGQCPNGGTQATTTTVTQSYLCTNGQQAAQGNPVTDTTNNGNPVCNTAPVNGACGAANSTNRTTAPSANLCSVGSTSAVTGSGPWSWSCVGSNGGTTASCVAAKSIDGVCGAANGVSVTTKPASALCSTGAASTVNGAGPWTWSCAGSDGGATASCSAAKRVDGACGAANGAEFPSTPVSSLCSSGTVNGMNGAGPWAWNCLGANGGANASCASPLLVNGACGSSNGTFLSTTPTTGLCNSGIASAVAGTGPWTWMCSGSSSGTTASCAANLLRQPLSTAGQSFISAPPLTSIPSPKPGGHVWYIDGINGSDSNNGLTSSTAFKTIDKGTLRWMNAAYRGGDVVVIMPGTYYATLRLQYDNVGGSMAGTADHYTIVMGMPGQARPVIIGNQPYQCEAANGVSAVQIYVPYVRISGLDIAAPGDGFSAFPGGLSSWGIVAQGGVGGCTNTQSTTQFVGSAIYASGGYTNTNGVYTPNVHHVIIDNNILHDSGAAGVGSNFSDYVIIQGNIVYNNANWAINQVSGISIGFSLNYDSVPGYHTAVINNIVYNNQVMLTTTTTPSVIAYYGPPVGYVTCPAGTGPGTSGGGCNTDGNGIIIDSNDSNPYVANSGYVGATLIYGNVSYDNGGAGVIVYKSSNVDVINNTTYHNGKDIYLMGNPSGANNAEMGLSVGTNLHAYNNIVVPLDGGHPALWIWNTTNPAWKYNLSYGGVISTHGSNVGFAVDGTNIMGADPLFVNPPSGSVPDAYANFMLQGSSPALQAGAPLPYVAIDAAGSTVPTDRDPNMGAYAR